MIKVISLAKTIHIVEDQQVLERDVHLVILDMMLPELDGWSACGRIRRGSNVPIPMLTARSEDFEDEARTLSIHIRNLRAKLGEHAKHIDTVIRPGYIFEEQP